MGLFDLFAGKERQFKRHAARVATKKSQNQDRWASLRALADMKTEESARALLARFTFRIDPSITDQEEKDLAMRGIVGAGDAAIVPVREFLLESDSIAWPLKMLEPLVGPELLVGALLELLEKMGTEYERDPQKKIDLLAVLEDRVDSRIRLAVERFLEDANENARFHAAGAVLAQEDAVGSQDALLAAFLAEEGVRVRVRVLDGWIENDWEITSRLDEVMPQLPNGYVLDGAKVRKKK